MRRAAWPLALAILVGAAWLAVREESGDTPAGRTAPAPVADTAREPASAATDAPGAAAPATSAAAPRPTSRELPNPALLPGSVPVPPELQYRLLHDGAEPRPPLPTVIEYPLAPKYADDPLSSVPHAVVGAWDEAPDSPDPGARRAFILVVEPGLEDAALGQLARDVRARHRDADFLNLRVFDSRQAATTPSHVDGGAFVHSHLVAELRWNARTKRQTLRVRGRAQEP